VGVDDGHLAARLQDAVRLAERVGHHYLVGPTRPFLGTAIARGVGHRLALLRRRLCGEVLRVEMTDGALEPDVEEVRDVGVGDVVIVGRVRDDRIERGIGAGKRGGRAAGDGGAGTVK
jgi:hypothetical protein